MQVFNIQIEAVQFLAVYPEESIEKIKKMLLKCRSIEVIVPNDEKYPYLQIVEYDHTGRRKKLVLDGYWVVKNNLGEAKVYLDENFKKLCEKQS